MLKLLLCYLFVNIVIIVYTLPCVHHSILTIYVSLYSVDSLIHVIVGIDSCIPACIHSSFTLKIYMYVTYL